MPDLMPTIFLGHANPLHGVPKNVYTDGWKTIGAAIHRFRTSFAVSAHWYIPGCGVTANAVLPTSHAAGTFSHELHEVASPAPGSPKLARRVKNTLSPLPVALDERWGIDHRLGRCRPTPFLRPISTWLGFTGKMTRQFFGG